MVRLVVAAVLASAAGCSCATASVSDAGPATDAYPPSDAWVFDALEDASAEPPEASVEGGALLEADVLGPDDAFVEAHTSVDAAELEDGAVFDCATCPAPRSCAWLACDGACDYAVEPDGHSCADPSGGVCIAGGCEARRCGDGWRERGEGLAREECDDGNVVDDDGCSAICSVEVLPIATEAGRSHHLPAFGYPAAGVDDAGNTAVAWTEDSASGAPRLVLRRFDPLGVALDATPVELDTLPVSERADATVQGLASGWVVGWRSSSVDPASGFDVAYRLVQVAGAPGGARMANVADSLLQQYVTVARIDSGFVIGWMTADVPAIVSARLFAADGAPVGAPFVVVPRDARGRSAPFFLGRGGERWTAGFMESRTTKTEMRGIGRLREYDGATPVGSAFDVMSGGVVVQLVLAEAETGLVVGALDGVESGTLRARWIARGTMPVDDADVVSYGTAGTESDLAVAAVGDGEWFAVYRAPMTLEGAQVVTSPGLAAMPELDTLRADFGTHSFEERFSIAPFDDGWWIVWDAFDGTASSLRMLRVSRPAP